MAELMKKKKLTEVDVADSVSASAKIPIINNGKVQQASVDEVLKVGTFIDESINNQFKVLSGTSVVATDSSSGYATDFSCVANTEQKQYTGKNKYPLQDNRAVSIGVTAVFKDNNISLSGTSTSSGGRLALKCADFVLSAGSYIISRIGSQESTALILHNSSDNSIIANLGAAEVPFTLSEETTVFLGINVNSGVTYSGNFDVMIRPANTDATYEPYTGGASPNPSYPQAIFNSGDCVDMMQGGYSGAAGVYYIDTKTVCNVNKIPCKSGDVVKIGLENANSIALLFYNEDSYLSYVSTSATTSYEATIPSGVTHFNFNIANTAGLTVDTVGKIELTINGKYVLQVKSVNKNIITKGTSDGTVTKQGITYTENSDGSVTAIGTATQDSWYHIKKNTSSGFSIPKGEWVLSGCPSGGSMTKYNLYAILSDNLTVLGREYGNGVEFTLDEGVDNVGIVFKVLSGQTINVTVYPMLRPKGTDDTYAPHKESISTILLDEPTRSSRGGSYKDVIEYVDNGYKVRRRLKARVFNGSESWVASTPTKSGLYRYDVYISDTSRKTYSAMCSHFVMSSATTSFADNVTEVSFAVHPTNGNFCFFTEFATVDEFKAWLAENPITVQYEMAEEVIENIADQTPFYQIPTYDGGTTISTTDRLQPQIEVEYPTAKAAGIASEGFAKGNLALEQIKALITSTATVTATEEDTEEVTV